MSRNIYARCEKLHDVSGRIGYTNSPNTEKKIENVQSTYDTSSQSKEADMQFWRELAAFNQNAYQRTSNASRESNKCCEAREVVLELPNRLFAMEHDALAKEVADFFKARYQVECNVALHLNESKSNFHAHIIFAERTRVADPEPKIATRNTFFDERGRKVRTKKEILNEDGSIRNGCRIVPKGANLNDLTFSSKNTYLKSTAFTKDVKQAFADKWNQMLEFDAYQVFDPNDIYLPKQKLIRGKSTSIGFKNDRIEEHNKVIDDYNKIADVYLETFPSQRDELIQRKEKFMKIRKEIHCPPEYLTFAIKQFMDKMQKAIIKFFDQFKQPLTLDQQIKNAKKTKKTTEIKKKKSRDIER